MEDSNGPRGRINLVSWLPRKQPKREATMRDFWLSLAYRLGQILLASGLALAFQSWWALTVLLPALYYMCPRPPKGWRDPVAHPATNRSRDLVA